MKPGEQIEQRPGIWIIDAEGLTRYANDRMAEILGSSRSDIVGHSSFDFVFTEDVENAQHLFESKRCGDCNTFHFKLRRQDGTGIWVDVQGTPLFNAAGVFDGIVGTFAVSKTTALRSTGH